MSTPGTANALPERDNVKNRYIITFGVEVGVAGVVVEEEGGCGGGAGETA